jgi:hypothetical protein
MIVLILCHPQGGLELIEENMVLVVCFLLLFAYFSILKMEAISPSERSVKFYRTTRQHILDDRKGKVVPVLRRVEV